MYERRVAKFGDLEVLYSVDLQPDGFPERIDIDEISTQGVEVELSTSAETQIVNRILEDL